MKNNEYLQKYGQKALQILNKKTNKQTIDLDNSNISQDENEYNRSNENNNQHQYRTKCDHKHKVSAINKSTGRINQKITKISSQKSLSKNNKEKSKSKSNLMTNSVNSYENQYTFQKPLNMQSLVSKNKDDNPNRKKLIISGLSTPKNRSTRMVSALEQKIKSSSTKKKVVDIKISQKLNDVLHKGKSTKAIVKQLLECLEMISEHQCKINKWISQFKDIVYHIANQTILYKKKHKEQVTKNKKLQKELQELQCNNKSNGNVNSGNQKKRKPIQMIIMQQNQKLREKVQKLQHKIQNYQKKQMILIQALQKMKPASMKKAPYQTNSSSKKEQNNVTAKMKADFYGSLDEDVGEDGDEQDEQQLNEQQENY